MGSPWQSEIDAIDATLGKKPPDAPPPPASDAPPGQPDHAAEIAASLANPAQPAPPPQSWSDYLTDVGRNFNTSVQKGFSNIAGLPHVVGQLGDKAMDLFADQRLDLGKLAAGDQQTPGPSAPMVPPGPGWLTRNTPSPEDITAAHFAARNQMFPDQPPAAPYVPQTAAGKIGSEAVQGLIGGAAGGPEGAVARTVAGGGGAAAGAADRLWHPDAPWWEQLLANVAGAGTAAGIVGAGRAGYNAVTGLLSDSAAKANAEARVADQIAKASGQSGGQLASTIEANQQQWTPGTRPDLGNLTESPGVRGMVYADTTRALKQNDPTYQQNTATTAEAQRTAVAGARPDDAAANLKQAQDDLAAATAAIPAGLSKQEAGEQFRANLAEIQSQREAARGPAGAAFDALKTDQTPVDLTGIKDYARTQAAENAGDYGKAYGAALSQLSSATGVTPGTAAFASSARTALNDLASSYGRQGMTAAQKAVLDVRAKLDDYLQTAVPAVGEASAGWKAASKPLDVFDAAPFGKVLAKDQYGRGYVMDNESVVRNFLESPGSSDALDRLHEIFGNPEASSAALQQYIASKVTNADGTINQAALAKIQGTGPGGYGAALMRFPTLQKQFSTAEGAAAAVDQQQNYQKLYNTVESELGTQTQTGQGSNFYSANKFDKFVSQNSDLIDQAYTPEQAKVVRRVNDELQNIAQTVAQGKAPGSPGTAQLLEKAGEHRGAIGAGVGAFAGSVGERLFEHMTGMGVPGLGEALGIAGGAVIGNRQQKVAAIFDQVRRQALTDPEYARSLLIKFDPSGVNAPAAQRALQYVMQRTPFLSAAGQAQPSSP
jgi:hypothetical protein